MTDPERSGSARTKRRRLGTRLARRSAELPRSAFHLLHRPRRRRAPRPGAAPGEIVLPPEAPPPRIHLMRYSPETFEEREMPTVSELETELARSGGATLWVDVQGFGDRRVLERLRSLFGIHPLALADVVHVPQRPKVELYGDRVLIITQMAREEAGRIELEQVSLVLGPGWVVTFQERPGDVFDPVRQRIRSASTKVRQLREDYLSYALVDAIIDGFFPVLEMIADLLDPLEETIVANPTPAALGQLHALRRLLLQLHRVQWRQRDAIASLLREEELPFSDEVRVYLRDAQDHAVQILDAIESYREMIASLMDLYLSSTSNRLNEVMKTLTVMASIFIPLTFIAGVYGMNFETMPELEWRWGYPAALAAMAAVAGGLWWWFRRRGWVG